MNYTDAQKDAIVEAAARLDLYEREIPANGPAVRQARAILTEALKASPLPSDAELCDMLDDDKPTRDGARLVYARACRDCAAQANAMIATDTWEMHAEKALAVMAAHALAMAGEMESR